MIIIMKPEATGEHIVAVEESMKKAGMHVQINSGTVCTVLGVLGDTHRLDKSSITLFDGVERVMPVQEPYKKANRKFHPDNTVVNAGGVKIGGSELVIMAGPCSVESREQITCVASSVKKAGAKMLRGGAFKPRTSPYSFQGLKEHGLELLIEARKETGLPIVTELMSCKYIDLFEEHVDLVQIGARNMQNYELLKELGQMSKPILLKRGFSSTIEEWLMSAEYIMANGNLNVILCERGIRTFENYTRNTLDLSAIPAIKKLSHLPIVVDPSHATGMSWMVESMSLAAIAAGADGLLIEVHNNPCQALCDGPQSLEPGQFEVLTAKLKALAPLMNRTL